MGISWPPKIRVSYKLCTRSRSSTPWSWCNHDSREYLVIEIILSRAYLERNLSPCFRRRLWRSGRVVGPIYHSSHSLASPVWACRGNMDLFLSLHFEHGVFSPESRPFLELRWPQYLTVFPTWPPASNYLPRCHRSYSDPPLHQNQGRIKSTVINWWWVTATSENATHPRPSYDFHHMVVIQMSTHPKHMARRPLALGDYTFPSAPREFHLRTKAAHLEGYPPQIFATGGGIIVPRSE